MIKETGGDVRDHEPDANKVNGYIDREGLLEIGGKLQCIVVLPRIHVICERKLLLVVLWKQANLINKSQVPFDDDILYGYLLQHASETEGSISC
jgi:hypothetical protein